MSKLQKVEYKPAPGAGMTIEQAKKIGAYLKSMDLFSPGEVLDAATPIDSPLHEYFTWNDREAGHRYRLREAQYLINHVNLLINAPDGRTIETRAFLSVKLQDENNRVIQRYVSVQTISANESMREQVIARALSELQGWKKRYELYREILGSDIFDMIDNTIDSVNRKSLPKNLKKKPRK